MENLKGQFGILANVRKYSFEELKAEMSEEDALFMGTAAFVIATTWIDYLRLQKCLEAIPEYYVPYHTFATGKLRVVKEDQYLEFIEWREARRADRISELRIVNEKQYEEFLEWRKNRNERHR